MVNLSYEIKTDWRNKMSNASQTAYIVLFA